MSLTFVSRLAILLEVLLLCACAEAGGSLNDVDSQSSKGGKGGKGGSSGGGGGSGGFDVSELPAPPHCGNGEKTKDEACDDGNTESGDGCSANCLQVEPGFSCIPPGAPCHHIARCGDGVAVFPELCDDGNTEGGDGCSETCKVELGFKCEGSPSECSPTTCGDKKIEGAESCDDGNSMPFDGCSAYCQNEPRCTEDGCESECGDGIVVNEACDDGNNVDGDGCSAKCEIEAGFTCVQPDLGETMTVPIVLRDFRYGKPTDFQPSAIGRTEALTGMVESRLDKDGKPVYTGISNSFVTSKESFSKWYRDEKGTNSTTVSRLVLWNNGEGIYVNRLGANGERYEKTKPAYYCGNVGAERTDGSGAPIPCTSMYTNDTDCDKAIAAGLEVRDCVIENGNYRATIVVERIDGNPLFFPVDGDSFTPESERSYAQLPAPIYSDDWGREPGEPLHNFSFTSEVRYWFRYDAANTYTLNFTGDDDVWLFINNILAVDLGGIHTPVNGSVTLDESSAAAYNIESGNVYNIAVFQAERQTTSSSYRLTLAGFSSQPSDCRPTCGDGIVGLGEECDDGVNEGGYGKCGPNCRLGEYCGDGIVQTEYEDCDDGINIGDPCPSGCVTLIII
ncbi:MAG: DUF4215 domain-containing protein [Deltaproteobacteria bacterium]|nr:DUF4215 domain-containing protein [Deltaproteobacteria bacterium]